MISDPTIAGGPAAVGVLRRVVPHPGGRRRAQRWTRSSRCQSASSRHSSVRRFFALVLRTTRAGIRMSGRAARSHGRARRPTRSSTRVDAVVAAGRVARPHRPERRRQDDPTARDRPPRPLLCGEIALGGRLGAPTSRERELARLVAVVPQEPSTPPWMTVAEYVLLGRTPHLGPLAREGARDRDAAGTRARAARPPPVPRSGASARCAGGEKQRVVVARGARAGGVDRPPRRADGRARHRAPAAGARPARRAARRSPGSRSSRAMHDLTLAAQYADRMLLLNARPRRRRTARRWTSSRRRPSRSTTAPPSTSSPVGGRIADRSRAGPASHSEVEDAKLPAAGAQRTMRACAAFSPSLLDRAPRAGRRRRLAGPAQVFFEDTDPDRLVLLRDHPRPIAAPSFRVLPARPHCRDARSSS